jgi:hypothetical protein
MDVLKFDITREWLVKKLAILDENGIEEPYCIGPLTAELNSSTDTMDQNYDSDTGSSN